MGNKTILQYFQEHTNASNVIFVVGQYEFRINKGADGTVTAKHNFDLGSWTNIPDSYYIDVTSHLSEHGHISSIKVQDTNGNDIFAMPNDPQLVVF